MPTQVKDVQIVLRVPSELAESLDFWVKQRGTNRAAFIRQLLVERLNWLWGERDAEIYERCPLTEDELIGTAPGALADLPPWEGPEC